MNRANRSHNAAVVDALAPTPSDRILDVGFGGGVALRYVLAGPAERVVGVDLSEDMVLRARRVFWKEVSKGRLRLEQASADQLPFEDRSFDGVYYSGPHGVRRVLKDDGRIVLGVDPRSKKHFAEPFRGFDNKDAEEVLLRAGFGAVTVHESHATRQIVSATR